jgi:hypothetical protein
MTIVISNDHRRAAIGDMREFLRAGRAEGQRPVRGASPKHEMGAIYELSLDNLFPPVLLFQTMKSVIRRPSLAAACLKGA